MIILSLVGVLGAVLMLEAAGRLYIAIRSKQMPVDFQSLQKNSIHQYDAVLGWALRPNEQMFIPYKTTTNSQGLRNPELREMEGQMRILALGDSRTFGDGVDDEYTWPYLLNQKLNKFQSGRFEVINGGVCGWNSLQGLQFLRSKGLQLKPHLVICAFGANDWKKAGSNGIGWVDWDDLKLRWGIEALLRDSIKGGASMVSSSPFGPREFLVSPGEYTDAIDVMSQLCHAQGAGFVVLYLPSQSEIGIAENMVTYWKIKWLSRGVAQYSLSDFWDVTEMFSRPVEQHYVDPIHFSPSGNALVAECLYNKITEPIISASRDAL